MFKRYLAAGFLLLLLIAALNNQTLSDWWRLQWYSPPPEIVQLAEKAAMSPRGEKLFYVSTPVITDGADFSAACPKGGHGFVLGCYVNSQIFILRPAKEELANIKQVTAAHEMLHAVYARLSSAEREHIDALLAQEFTKINDERVLGLMDQYERESPAAFHDELHSVLPTQVETLSPELEEYYSQYFYDRSVVIAAYHSYVAVFADTQERLDQLSNQIAELNDRINYLNTEVNYQEDRLATMRTRMDNYLDAGQTEQYNALVAPYNHGVSTVRDMVDEHNRLVDTLNTLIKEHNEMALYESALIDSLDASKLPQRN